jgi:hypothetical protein
LWIPSKCSRSLGSFRVVRCAWSSYSMTRFDSWNAEHMHSLYPCDFSLKLLNTNLGDSHRSGAQLCLETTPFWTLRPPLQLLIVSHGLGGTR